MQYRKSSQIICITFTAILLSACASGPSKGQLKNADFGRNMTPDECVSIAENTISNTLKDPNSAQFRNQQCFKGYWSSAPIIGMSVAFGWVQKGEVNSKNSFGGYVGFRPYQVLIRNGQVVRYCLADDDGLCVPMSQ